MIDAIGWVVTLIFVPLVIFVGMSMERRNSNE